MNKGVSIMAPKNLLPVSDALARILGAAEIYDALTTSRPYQEKMPPEFAVDRMRDLAGSVLDPEVYRALEAAVRRRQALVFLDDARS